MSYKDLNLGEFSSRKEFSMKLNLSVDLKKLVNDVRGPKGTAALTEEFERISGELNKLKAEVKPQAQARLKKAEAQYHAVLKKLNAVQKDLDKEVKQGVSVVKKQAKSLEKNFGKNLTQAKKLAEKQKTKIQAAFTKKKATTKKRAPSAAAAGTKKKASSKKSAAAHA
jgi:phage-related minor tail protein